jgi:hypothetical protein
LEGLEPWECKPWDSCLFWKAWVLETLLSERQYGGKLTPTDSSYSVLFTYTKVKKESLIIIDHSSFSKTQENHCAHKTPTATTKQAESQLLSLAVT